MKQTIKQMIANEKTIFNNVSIEQHKELLNIDSRYFPEYYDFRDLETYE